MTRVLFVDDEAHVLQGLKAMLYRRRGEWDMTFAEGGARAQDLLGTASFDVLVTDLRMPGIDGLTLLHYAKERAPGTVRIVLSGLAEADQPGRLAPVAHLYLSKPCEPQRLENAIARSLAARALVTSAAIRSRLGSAGVLPSMPATLARLEAALAQNPPSLPAVVAVLESDPGVAAKIMQVASSAFFRLPRSVTSVEQAVTHVGLPAIRALAGVAEIFAPAPRLPERFDLLRAQTHSVNVARVARALSPTAALGDRAFLAGLLRDVGSLLLAGQFPAEMDGMIAAIAAGTPLADAEAQHIGISHGVAGAYLLSLWGLPDELVQSVAHHGAPVAARQDAFSAHAAVSIAECLVEELDSSVPSSLHAAEPHPDPEYLAAVQLGVPWAELKQRARVALDVVGSI